MIDLSFIEPKILGKSQKGQDSFIDYIFKNIVIPDNKFYVEFGAYDGITSCNTYFLKSLGWNGLLIDDVYEKPELNLIRSKITIDNINSTLQKHNVPYNLDFISIDIDGNDIWIADQILKSFKPSVIMIEANMRFNHDISLAQKYNPDYSWDGKSWCGASPLAIVKTLNKYDYSCVHIHIDDMIFIHKDKINDSTKPLNQLYLSNYELYNSHNSSRELDIKNWTSI